MRDGPLLRVWRTLSEQLSVLLVVVAAVIAGLAGWHTLGADFALSSRTAAVLAAAQAAPLVAAVRWPVAASLVSTAALVGAAVLVRAAGMDVLWPDPNLYVHVGVLFVAGLRARPSWLAALWGVMITAGGVLAVLGNAAANPPGLLASGTLGGVALVLAAALQHTADVLAHQRAATAAERTRAAQLEERARIARELHDVVAHHMSVVAIQSQAAPLRANDTPDELAEAFQAIRSQAVASLVELRRVVNLLRDTDQDAPAPQPGLEDVEDLLEGVRAAGTPVTKSVLGTQRRLSAGVQLTIYRIVQEALNNVMKHAPDARASVELRYQADSVQVTVANETSSSLPQPPNGSDPGHGLVGMRERAAMLGGEIEAGPTGDGGYRMTALLPTTTEPGS